MALITNYVYYADGGNITNFTLKLLYEVRFVTAHPCVPSQHTRLLSPTTTTAISTPQSSTTTMEGHADAKVVPVHSGHPLHSSYNYSCHSLLNVLQQSTADKTGHKFILNILSTTNNPNEVYVIDCSLKPVDKTPPANHIASQLVTKNSTPTTSTSEATSADDTDAPKGPEDAEMLARAWCAEHGFNALISRRHQRNTQGKGKGHGEQNRGCCIACSVREARALGWRIVLRIG